MLKFVDPVVVAERHLLPAWLNEQRQLVYIVGSIHERVQPDHHPDRVPVATPGFVTVEPTTPNRTAPEVWDWNCVALHETGGDWTAHGPSYSSALGIMDAAIRENASPDVAARVLAGTATRAEQIAIGEQIVDRFGVNAWAPSTVAACS